ncbi:MULTISPECIES: serine hydrolase [Streptomyces]|uniref:Class A beta-lactamase-related serine hydrolase n=1 Tax=Streptomyces olivaceus TaxID=47716 RepID=A0ABS7W1A3_STROV|nr:MULTISPECIES: serine hydrolase [Streptomyces]AOW88027.1 serine hydrolase [Streptomyces olivaceus]MBZ6082544.1 class A beta-lactamase-related serine hydrolase [Streptomyces olivaceus]MBZ6088714.1 class A beta-lactamase-related serine hydrolase [Streptomyces olivaceus]MBZ6095912.1 class A beta-lactamase-related serine hydrolase [Streptomyces olivaceus]MBZ6104366.1 class A beta-lactamase-related serine hydrolase [Streptomyces olivaceus]
MTETATAARLDAAFADAGVTGWLHAVDIDSGAQTGTGADQPVCTASVHKVCVLVTLHELAAAGSLDLTEQVECPPAGRTPGPTGLAAMLDPVRLSLRDAAFLMMSVSDNTAADLLLRRVGRDAVNRTTARLGLTRTRMAYGFGEMLATMREDAGPAGARALADPHVIARLRALDPARTNRGTPRDMTRLLGALWRDETCPAEYGAAMRRIMGLQVWPHRLASGFPFDDVHVAGKTGTLPTLRNEVGVVEYPDGGRYAVAVFTRTANPAATLPAADAVIGTAARIAVDALRAP